MTQEVDVQTDDVCYSEVCMYVASQIFNGQAVSSPSLGRFCGTRLPTSIPSSSGRHLTVQFMSNSDGETSTGFRLDFAQPRSVCGGNIQLSEDRPITIVTSPNYPNNYQNNVNCALRITAPSNSVVQLQFSGDVFQIEAASR